MTDNRTVEQRFWDQVDRTDGCWLWTRALDREGYARLTVNNRSGLAHRWAYKRFVGPIPEGLELDHLCRVRHCVNPAHLEPVTHAENMRRGVMYYATQTHCIRGHPFDETNTIYRRTPSGNIGRACRECRRASGRKHRAGNRELDRARARAWRLANPDKRKAYSAANKDKQRAYYLAHQDTIKARTRAWVAANPDRVKANKDLAKARRAGETV